MVRRVGQGIAVVGLVRHAEHLVGVCADNHTGSIRQEHHGVVGHCCGVGSKGNIVCLCHDTGCGSNPQSRRDSEISKKSLHR